MKLPRIEYKTQVRSLGTQNPYAAVALGSAWGKAGLAGGSVAGMLDETVKMFEKRHDDLQEDQFRVAESEFESELHDKYDNELYLKTDSVVESYAEGEEETHDTTIGKHPAYKHRPGLYREKRKAFMEEQMAKIDNDTLRGPLRLKYEELINNAYIGDLKKANDELYTFGRSYVETKSKSLLKQGFTDRAIELVTGSEFYMDEEKKLFEQYARNYAEHEYIANVIRTVDNIDDITILENEAEFYRNVSIGANRPENDPRKQLGSEPPKSFDEDRFEPASKGSRETFFSDTEAEAAVRQLESAVYSLNMKDATARKAAIEEYTFLTKESIKAFKTGDPSLLAEGFMTNSEVDAIATGNKNLTREYYRERGLYYVRVRLGPMKPAQRDAYINSEISKIREEAYANDGTNEKYIVPAQIRINDLESLKDFNKYLESEFDKNPWQYATKYEIANDVQLDYSSPDAYDNSIKARLHEKQLIETSQGKRISMFTEAMIDDYQVAFDSQGNLDSKVLFLGAVFNADPGSTEYEMSKMSEAGYKPEHVAVGRLSMQGKYKDAKKTLRGAEMRRDDKYKYILRDKGVTEAKKVIRTELGDLWANDTQLKSSIGDAVISHYYESFLSNPSTEEDGGKLDTNRLAKSIAAVRGDTTTVNGVPFPNEPGLDPNGGLQKYLNDLPPKYYADQGGFKGLTEPQVIAGLKTGEFRFENYRGSYFIYYPRGGKFITRRDSEMRKPVPFSFKYDPSVNKDYAEEISAFRSQEEAKALAKSKEFYNAQGLSGSGYGGGDYVNVTPPNETPKDALKTLEKKQQAKYDFVDAGIEDDSYFEMNLQD